MSGTIEKARRAGDLLQILIPGFALLETVVVHNSRYMSVMLVCSIMATLVLTHTLKYLFNYTKLGTRPNGGKNGFPSGHTASAFAGAAFIHVVLPVHTTVVVIAYLLAAYTGYSRVISKNHYYRDVIAGALLATSTVFTVAYLYGL